jgi:phosphatidylinositol glycan class C protein
MAVAAAPTNDLCAPAWADTLDTLSSCLLFCATLSLLSPVLRTLTRSYADDTIWALATSLGLVHLITHDYNYVNSGIGRYVYFRPLSVVRSFWRPTAGIVPPRLTRWCMSCSLCAHASFSGTVSLNAAIFTAVLLGSRLQSNEHVFAFVLLAIEIFAMFPIFQREVKVRGVPCPAQVGAGSSNCACSST